MPAHCGCRGSEIVGFIERADLGLVSEQNVDMAIDEIAKRCEVPLYAERVGKAECHLAARGMGNSGRFAEGVLCLRRVEKIALKIGDSSSSHNLRVDVIGPEIDTGAEIGVHRSLAVGGHENQTARGGRAAG